LIFSTVKRIFLAAVTSLVLATPLLADYMESAKSKGTFVGVITAIETERDSITVQSDENTVKMFQVSAARKSQLATGDRVRVSYIDEYQWPLKTTSVTSASAVIEK
jgi:hypothetical protein